jgi:FkbM family methyltransferase
MAARGVALNSGVARAVLGMRGITKHSPAVRGLGKVIPPLMALASGIPQSLVTQVVDDVDGDLTMELYLDDEVQGYMFWNPSGYERHTLSVIKKYVKPGDTFLDLGANVGFFSLAAAKLVGDRGRVIAIEPDPENFAQLKRNVSLNQLSTVALVNKGVSDEPGRLRLARNLHGNRGAHTLLQVDDADEYADVDVDTIDAIVDSLALSRVDIIKIDIEGFEYRALRSSRVFDYRPIIVTEVLDSNLARDGISEETYLGMLRRHGYDVRPIERDVLNYLCLPRSTGDAR